MGRERVRVRVRVRVRDHRSGHFAHRYKFFYHAPITGDPCFSLVAVVIFLLN